MNIFRFILFIFSFEFYICFGLTRMSEFDALWNAAKVVTNNDFFGNVMKEIFKVNKIKPKTTEAGKIKVVENFDVLFKKVGEEVAFKQFCAGLVEGKVPEYTPKEMEKIKNKGIDKLRVEVSELYKGNIQIQQIYKKAPGTNDAKAFASAIDSINRRIANDMSNLSDLQIKSLEIYKNSMLEVNRIRVENTIKEEKIFRELYDENLKIFNELNNMDGIEKSTELEIKLNTQQATADELAKATDSKGKRILDDGHKAMLDATRDTYNKVELNREIKIKPKICKP